MSLAKNKKAYFDYEILETLEAGLVLSGSEVKSVKKGQVNLKGSFISFNRNKAGISGMHISRYKPAGKLVDYDPYRWRELLLHKKQINYLGGKALEKGLTITPLKVYTKRRLIKVEIAVAKGKKTLDKRETIKKRDIDREVKRTLKDLGQRG
jgi:SsrA-binding protein